MSLSGSLSPPQTSQASVSLETLAAAAERRTRQATPQLTAAQLTALHEKRQKFRRLIDPGITRPNPKDQALASLKTLITISDNLLQDPENPKYQQFKPTNSVIKRNLMDPKGALEYAIELGFRPEVKNFQPYYTFSRRYMEDLKMGNSILKEYINLETEKQERTARAKQGEKAAIAAAAEKVKLAFMDDRKTKELRDDMEKESRAGRALAAARQAPVQASTNPASQTREEPMPGSGHILGILSIDHADELPAYERVDDTEE